MLKTLNTSFRAFAHDLLKTLQNKRYYAETKVTAKYISKSSRGKNGE